MPRSPCLGWAAFAMLFSGLPLLAQKLPAPSDPNRLIQVFALAPLLDNLATPQVDPEAARQQRHCNAVALVKTMRACCHPPMGRRDDIELLGDETLVVLALPQQVAWIETALKRLANQDRGVLQIAARTMLMPDAAFQAQLASSFGPIDENGSTQKVIAPDRAEMVLTMMQRDRTVQGISLPQLALLAGEYCEQSADEAVPYRKDYAPHTLTDATVQWDPIWAEVHDGPRFEVAWLPERDGQITLATAVVLQQLQRPIPTFDTVVQGRKVQIDLPAVTATQVRGCGVLQPGGMLLLAQKTGKQWLVVALTWRRG